MKKAAKQPNSKSKNIIHRPNLRTIAVKVWPWVVLILIFLMVLAILLTQRYAVNNSLVTNNNNQNKSDTNSQQPETKELTKYEYQVKYVDLNHNPVYVQVYTTAKSDKQLIELNDKLLPKYQKLKRNVLIGYFDDPKVAQTYFQHQESTPNKSQTSHFVASMYLLSSADPESSVASDLTRLSGGVKILKSY
ncbi:hypothetical protein KC946_01460 [Candidatus Saccharibacteria bacterium]|nr:hypothetical protein [Candidatus Saccharibacteria bacterium]